MKYIKYYLIFVWIELIVLFAVGCSAPIEKRGDWMEHLNDKQFTSVPLNPWWRRNYLNIDELKEMWNEAYLRTQEKETNVK
jgi:hypothetical protein